MRDILEKLVGEMVDKGIRFDDAQREFEKRFIARVLQSHDGNLGKAAKTLGVHRNTLTRKLQDLKIKTRSSAG
jgi:DNA-binding NtrC family response regulator